jgi:hypothetical protein
MVRWFRLSRLGKRSPTISNLPASPGSGPRDPPPEAPQKLPPSENRERAPCQLRRHKKKSLLAIPTSFTRSGRNGALADYRMCMTMFGSSISEAGKSIVKTNGRSLTSSTGRFMLLPFGQIYSSDQAKALSREVQVSHDVFNGIPS